MNILVKIIFYITLFVFVVFVVYRLWMYSYSIDEPEVIALIKTSVSNV